MEGKDEDYSFVELDDSIRHEVDPLLSLLTLSIDDGEMAKPDVWFCLSGVIMFGRLVPFKEGFNQLMPWAKGDQEADNAKDEEERRLPTYAYLLDVRIMKEGSVIINSPVARIKLSHVSAWGIGVPNL